MPTLKELLRTEYISLKEVTEHLDALAHPDRVDQVTALGNKEQRKLWEIAEKSKPLTLEYLLPRDAEPLQYFPFEGKNSLPAFKRFQKVFYLDSDRNVCGYNNAWIGWLVGPGYYMTQMNPKAPEYEIQVDYTRIPTEHPDGWPEIKSNDIFPTMFVYGGTKDNLRWVSKDVVIGRAFKMGEDPMPNWFVLCRQTPAPASGE
jgi:hypothetical protein